MSYLFPAKFNVHLCTQIPFESVKPAGHSHIPILGDLLFIGPQMLLVQQVAHYSFLGPEQVLQV